MLNKISSTIKKLFNTEIATRTSDPNFYGALQFLPNPDPILRKMGQSQAVYDAIIMDAHVIGELRPIRAGAISYEWKLTAGGDGRVDKQALALCQSVFSRKPSANATWSDVIWTMYQAILRGFSVHEVVWDSVDGFIVPVKVVDRPTRRFTFGTDNELRLLTSENPLMGDAVEPYKFLLCQHMATFDNPYGIALLSSCFWPYTFKHNGFRFFVKFCEKYGIPWAIGKYPQGTPTDQQTALANSLAQMIEDAVAAIPDNGSVELLDASSGSGQLPQERLIDVCNREMSKALTSQTLGTEIQGKGSYAAAQTHRNREQDVNASDRKMVEDTMNTLCAWMTEINIPNAKPPTFEFYEESEARQDWVDTLDKARKFMPIPASFAYKITQIPQPVGNEPVLLGNEPATPIAQFSQAETNDDPIHAIAYTQQMAERSSAAINGLIEQVRNYGYMTEDLHELRDTLLSSYGDLDTQKLMSVMEVGFACATLAGRFDVQQEVEND